MAQGKHLGTDSGASTPIWATVEVPDFPALDKEINAEVCIIGAGIAGLTTALLLAEEGKHVVVADDGPAAQDLTPVEEKSAEQPTH